MVEGGDVPCYVIDASVAAKWHLPDETFAEQALDILGRYRTGLVHLFAPEQIYYEFGNAIRSAVRMRRISDTDGRAALEDFLAWGIQTTPAPDLLLPGYDWSIQTGCSLYDGTYLALADLMQCPFVYADRRLRTALGNRLPLALWIEDYRGQ